MIYVQSRAGAGMGDHYDTLLYTSASDLKNNGVLDTDEGEITVKPGTIAYMAGLTAMKQFNGTAWVDA